MFTPLERLVLGCIGVFASFAVFYFLWTYFILFQLLFPTTVFIFRGRLSNNRQSSNYFSVVVNNRQSGLQIVLVFAVEVNMRYLGLEAMARFASTPELVDSLSR